MKDINIGDIVKFVPYYAATGMQGANLKLQMPKYDCIALVYDMYTVRGVRHAHVMMPNRVKKVIGCAGLERLFKL